MTVPISFLEGINSTPGDSFVLDELTKVARHRRHIPRDQHAASLGRDPKHLGIGCAIWDHPSGAAKIDDRFPPPQPPGDLGIQVGVRLETKAQTRFSDLSLFARSKRSIMSGVRG